MPYKHEPQKQCKTCNQIKLREEFPTKKSGPNAGQITSGLCFICYNQHKASLRPSKKGQNYKPRKSHKLSEEDKKTAKSRYRKAKVDRIREYLGGLLKTAKCHDCPQTNLITFQFDHRDPSQKSFGLCTALRGDISLDKVKAEVAKCDIVCASCHAIRTAKMFGSWRLALLDV